MTPGNGATAAGLRFWIGGAVLAAALLAFGLVRPENGSGPFFAPLALAGVGYLATITLVARGYRPSGRALLACAALALLWRIPMLLAAPEPAADLRRYVWDARLVRAGLSPYAVVPLDPAHAHLRTPESWPLNNPDVPSPYPPGAQLFFIAATMAGESARAIKLAALLCDALVALVVWRSLIAAGRNPGWVLGYLWSPLVSIEVARHGHVDVVGALLVALAALALGRGRAFTGTIALALSVTVKPLSLVLVPVLWRRVSRWHVLAGLAVLAAVYLPFWSRGHLPIGSLPAVIERFRFNGPIFAGVAAIAGPVTATGFAVAAGLAFAVLARRRLSLSAPEAWAWPMAVTLLCAPLVYPWYLLWLTPFLVTRKTFPLTIWTLSILVTYVAWRRGGAQWGVPVWALAAQYGPVLAAAAWAWRGAEPVPGAR